MAGLPNAAALREDIGSIGLAELPTASPRAAMGNVGITQLPDVASAGFLNAALREDIGSFWLHGSSATVPTSPQVSTIASLGIEHPIAARRAAIGSAALKGFSAAGPAAGLPSLSPPLAPPTPPPLLPAIASHRTRSVGLRRPSATAVRPRAAAGNAGLAGHSSPRRGAMGNEAAAGEPAAPPPRAERPAGLPPPLPPPQPLTPPTRAAAAAATAAAAAAAAGSGRRVGLTGVTLPSSRAAIGKAGLPGQAKLSRAILGGGAVGLARLACSLAALLPLLRLPPLPPPPLPP